MNIKESIKRLNKLSKADNGFYIVALHSFIEGYINEIKQKEGFKSYNTNDKKMSEFEKKLRLLFENIKTNEKQHIINKVIKNISEEHYYTNLVRHQFLNYTEEETSAVTSNFLSFLEITGQNANTKTLIEKLKSWDHRKDSSDKGFRELTDNCYKLHLDYNFENTKEYIRLDPDSNDAEIDLYENHNHTLYKTHKYIQNIQRISSYSKVRADYERSKIRFTPEQDKIIKEIKILLTNETRKNIIIEGSAGTGKSLVLLEIFKSIESRDSYFLTYTKALTKYNKHLSSIIKTDNKTHDSIQNTDDFIKLIADQLLPKPINLMDPYNEDKQFEKIIIEANFDNICSLQPKEIVNIINSAICANNCENTRFNQSEYTKKLNETQKTSVWKLFERVKKIMDQTGNLTYDYCWVKLLKYLQKDENKNFKKPYFIFIDEAQDLTYVKLQILNLLAEKCLVMTVDDKQRIYSSITQLKVDNKAYSKFYLTTGFRNSNQILQFADNFLKKSKILEANKIHSIKEGSHPEIYKVNNNPEKLLKILVQKINIFIKYGGYESKDICVISTKKHFDDITRSLNESGITKTINIHRNDSYDFKNNDAISLSTIHSTKGLDFPIVMIYRPYLHHSTSIERKNNLLYVALTRAGDHLNIFIDTEHDTTTKKLTEIEVKI